MRVIILYSGAFHETTRKKMLYVPTSIESCSIVWGYGRTALRQPQGKSHHLLTRNALTGSCKALAKRGSGRLRSLRHARYQPAGMSAGTPSAWAMWGVCGGADEARAVPQVVHRGVVLGPPPHQQLRVPTGCPKESGQRGQLD